MYSALQCFEHRASNFSPLRGRDYQQINNDNNTALD